jgi:hypothetical protein
MSTKFTRSVFVWLDQVVGDEDLPSSAFKVAYVIAQCINEETGEGFPGTGTIAARIGMSQPTVIAMVRQLQVSGHLGVDPGRAGRGHSNRYRMIVKPQRAEVLRAPEKPQPAEGKHQPAELKPQPADMNYFNNHLNNHKAATPPLVVTVVTDDDRERGYAALWRVWPNKKHAHARDAYDELIDDGIDPDDLITEAKLYMDKTEAKEIPYLRFWLKDAAKSSLVATSLDMGRPARVTGGGHAIAPKSHFEAAYGDTQ